MYFPEVYFRRCWAHTAFRELNIMGCRCCNNELEGVITPRGVYPSEKMHQPLHGKSQVSRWASEICCGAQSIAVSGENWSTHALNLAQRGLIDLLMTNNWQWTKLLGSVWAIQQVNPNTRHMALINTYALLSTFLQHIPSTYMNTYSWVHAPPCQCAHLSSSMAGDCGWWDAHSAVGAAREGDVAHTGHLLAMPAPRLLLRSCFSRPQTPRLLL